MSLSADTENQLDMLAINAASAALMISDIPFGGPVGAVRMAAWTGWSSTPRFPRWKSRRSIARCRHPRSNLMVECGAQEVSEDLMVEALQLAHREIQGVVELQDAWRAKW